MKNKLILAGFSAVLFSSSASAFAPEFENMHKQLGIMEDIFRTSVAEQGSKTIRVTSISSTYLKGQGAVFNFNASSRLGRWGDFNFNFSLPEMPDFPQVSVEAPKVDIDGENAFVDLESINELTSEAIELAAEGYERAMESLSRNREGYQELREQNRDLHYELRDIEREARDIEFQLRRVEEKEEKEKLAAKKSKLELEKKEIKEKAEELRAELAQVRERQKQEKQQENIARTKYFDQLATSLADTLCLYGNGLKALPKDENVSLILKSAGDKVKNRYKDQIYVFTKKDITSCAIDKISSAKLLERGNRYQF